MPQQTSELDTLMQNNSTSPPQTTSEFYAESFSEVLIKSIGYYVVCEFLIGTNSVTVKEGILYAAGMNFLTLQDPDSDRFTVCDLYSLKFVTVYNSRPQYGQNNRMMPQRQSIPYSFG
ncbi:MAG: hypothetical protein HFG20_05400 [Anaerotruncus sp.]|nr:hypothetical protein [Anaerotruncus sp.]